MIHWRNGTHRYGILTITFHWVTLGLIALMVALGFWMGDLPDGSFQRFKAVELHKSVGITVLVLTLARFAWRWIDRPLPPPTSLTDWQKSVARILHGALYALLFLVPMAGWATASASTLGLPLRLYGALPWPDLPFTTASSGRAEDQQALEHLFHQVHQTLIITLVAMIAIHAAAALWHHFGLKDDTLRRMLPQLKSVTPARGEEA